MSYQVVGIAILAAIYALIKFLSATDVPRIKGLPEIPGVPIFGNLLQLGVDHARVTQKWARKYGPVFQTRLGTKRIIFVNSYDSVRHFWVTHQSALISRPTYHTFHSVVSSSQGFTIGTSPWDESCKRRRKAAATALNRPATQSYMPILDLESTVSIKELLDDAKGGTVDVDPNAYVQRFALNTSLTLNYGFRIDGSVDSVLLKEITHVEREISNFRSTSNNWQDYVPLLRLWGAQNSTAKEYRARRDKYLTDMLTNLQDRIAKGTDKPCITGNILKDPEAKLNFAELKSICLTMVSAGLDTVPGNVIMGLAYLSTERGQAVQAKALRAIEEVYPNGEAWEKCLVEEKVPYITALVKETLRYWTVIPICLPRTSIHDIPYEGTVIPAGTTFFMVRRLRLRAQALNEDADETCQQNRTPTRPTTTTRGSRSPTSLFRNVISTTRRWARRTTPTGPGRACAPGRTWRTASCTRFTFASLRRLRLCRRGTTPTRPPWTPSRPTTRRRRSLWTRSRSRSGFGRGMRPSCGRGSRRRRRGHGICNTITLVHEHTGTCRLASRRWHMQHSATAPGSFVGLT
ncbi:Phenylacetate 2-hydroxylase [Purpureocillium takamizusanense]|uniref:Phenylacetate 2-hydroxylase n=1 Tax=Purpureocillium takamizusanense TaxID=2060973 RepID=A0A9Q8QNZ8_9HYPO|nr:Phenylacetate 2-hydroxylase [Purpureocillium takamizusanense]UNI22169.1 Phenylacetate 2-hydroxylase [Purpureocillium takamizusanense]